MRIIGGKLRSRRIKTLPGQKLRPTSDRLRETLFDILAGEVVGKVFVDAYAGSGAVGLEALSRGAARAIFIENDRRAAAVLRENLRSLELETNGELIQNSLPASLRGIRAGIVFLDPPYSRRGEYEATLELLGKSPPPLVIAEHSARIELEPVYGALQRVRVLRQGDSCLSFYRRSGQELHVIK